MNYNYAERIGLLFLKGLAKLLVLVVAFPVVILLSLEGITLIFTDKISMIFQKLSSLRERISPVLAMLKTLAANSPQNAVPPESVL